MQPNNPYPQNNAQPPGQFDPNQFDFIMNSGQPNKKGLIPLPSDPKKKMLFMAVGGVAGLVLLLVLYFTIFGRSSGPVESLVSVAQQQNEIIRISDSAAKNVSSNQARKLSTMTTTVIASDRKKTIDYMAKNGRKVKAKELALKQDPSADQDLTNAQQNGRLDEVYTKITLDYLKKYQENLQSVYGSLGGNGKEIVEQSANNVKLILQDNQVSS